MFKTHLVKGITTPILATPFCIFLITAAVCHVTRGGLWEKGFNLQFPCQEAGWVELQLWWQEIASQHVILLQTKKQARMNSTRTVWLYSVCLFSVTVHPGLTTYRFLQSPKTTPPIRNLNSWGSVNNSQSSYDAWTTTKGYILNRGAFRCL